MDKHHNLIIFCVWLLIIGAHSANIALNKKVTTSSMIKGSSPSSIVDGKIDQIWRDGNCVQTNNGASSTGWICIDLEQPTFITTVKVYGRSDFNGGRLNKVKVAAARYLPIEITISNRFITHCGTFPDHVNTIEPIEIQCNYTGRYVIFFQEANLGGNMTICEAEVYNDPAWPQRNIALHKQVYMSSIYKNTNPSSMVDGIIEPYWNNNCAHTDGRPGTENWIAIDLKYYFFIIKVVAFNRKDCCAERVNDVRVGTITSFVNEEKFIPKNIVVCAHFPSKNVKGTRIEINCFMHLRYLIFQQPVNSPGYLTICEVEAYIKID